MTALPGMLARQGGGIHELYSSKTITAAVQSVVMDVPEGEDLLVRITGMSVTASGFIEVRPNAATQGTDFSRVLLVFDTGNGPTRTHASVAGPEGYVADMQAAGTNYLNAEINVSAKAGLPRFFRAVYSSLIGTVTQRGEFQNVWRPTTPAMTSLEIRHSAGANLTGGTIEVYRFVPTRQPVTSGEYKRLSLSADQTTSIDSGDRIQWDQIEGVGGATLDVATGIVTLPRGGKYKITCAYRTIFASISGTTALRWYDVTNAQDIGSRALCYAAGSTSSTVGPNPIIEAYVDTAAGAVEVECRLGFESGLNEIDAVDSYATIERVDVKPALSAGDVIWEWNQQDLSQFTTQVDPGDHLDFSAELTGGENNGPRIVGTSTTTTNNGEQKLLIPTDLTPEMLGDAYEVQVYLGPYHATTNDALLRIFHRVIPIFIDNEKNMFSQRQNENDGFQCGIRNSSATDSGVQAVTSLLTAETGIDKGAVRFQVRMNRKSASASVNNQRYQILGSRADSAVQTETPSSWLPANAIVAFGMGHFGDTPAVGDTGWISSLRIVKI